jgi:hypothetical protein
LIVMLAGAAALASAAVARADVTGANGTNVQDGENSNTTSQSGQGKTGSASGGQVSGVVSSGPASIDARNTSKDSSVHTGDARGSNSAGSFVGLNDVSGSTTISDVSGSCALSCGNVQDGSNRSNLSQTLSAISGDGVGGQVIGLIALSGASAITASNNSDGVDVTTGDADGVNSSSAFVGLNDSGPPGNVAITSDVTDSCASCFNVQDGNNRILSSQSVTSQSGDGIAGSLIGAATGGATSIDAKNVTNDSSVETGGAHGDNSAAYFAGLNTSFDGPTITATDIDNTCNGVDGCDNVQDGDNRVSSNQSTHSTSGDGVAGQVVGVAGFGGPVSVVADNTTRDSDVTSGDAGAANDLAAFLGLNDSLGLGGGPVVSADVTASCNVLGCDNVQDGTNRLTGSQTAGAVTGDGLAGQHLGILAAGNVSLDAKNGTWDSSADTGDADAANSAATFVGLNSSLTGPTITAVDVTFTTASNLQDGTNRRTLTQSVGSTSGDAVAGQVAGVVTSAGGSASVVIANTSSGVDSSSGESHFSNDDSSFVGLNFSDDILID